MCFYIILRIIGFEYISINIPVEIVNNVTGECYSIQISLSHEGEFGFTAVLFINLGRENQGYAAIEEEGGNAESIRPEGTDGAPCRNWRRDICRCKKENAATAGEILKGNL